MSRRADHDLAGPIDAPSTPKLLVFVAVATALHAVLLLLVFPPWGVWFLAPFVVAPLYAAAVRISRAPRAASRWAALAVAYVVALAPWLWTERWIIDVSELGWPALSALMAFWPTLFTGLLARLLRRGAGSFLRAAPAAGTTLAGPLVAAVAWSGIEAFRAHLFFDGYPWYLLAHPLIDASWLAQSAELWGVTPLTFLCAWSGALVADAIPGPRRRAGALAVTAVVWGLLAAGGALRLLTLPLERGPVIVAVQTNVPSSNKVRWTFEQQVEDFARARDLTLAAIRDARERGGEPALVAWPETMFPGFGLEPDTISLQRALRVAPADVFSSAVEQIVEATGIPMLLGSAAFEGLRDVDESWQWSKRFNSAYLVRGEPPYRRYDKMRLTPFGETMPYIRAWKALQDALVDLGARGFSFDMDEGSEAVVFELDDGTRFVTPICFEATMPGHCRDLLGGDGRRADLFINLSNDGWFGGDDDGRAAHELAVRWRAVEHRAGIVRVVNTGLTSLIDPAGRVLERLPPRSDGWLVAATVLSPGGTLFGMTGDVGSWLLMIATTLLAIGTALPRFARTSSAAGVFALAALLGAAAILPCGVVGCTSPPPKRSPRPDPVASPSALGSALGLDAPPSQQSWSTKEQSVAPEYERASADGPVRPVPPGLPVVSSGNLRQTAIELLQTAAKSGYPILEANAIEALSIDAAALRPVVGRGLVSPNRGVRFVAAMAVGRAKLENMATLIQPLLQDPSESVRAAAIFALARLGRPVDQTPLASMIRSDDPEVRGNALLVLGELGNPSAIPLLRSTIGLGMTRVDPARRRITDLQLAEALARLGEDSELEPIRAALFAPSQQAEIIALACQIIGRLRDGGSISSLQAIARAGGSATRPPEIRLLAFIALSELGAGDPTACGEYARGFVNDRNPQLRALAVRAVAGCELDASVPTLESKLYDQNPEVQMAAAGAILKLASTGHLPSAR